MKMKELSREERPREKLLEQGAATLCNAELLAILMRTGTGRRNVLDMARELLDSAQGSLGELASAGIGPMQKVSGIGRDKAATVMAALELGRRFAAEKSRLDGISITGPGMIYRHILPRLKGLDHEEAWAFYLNRANYITFKERLSSGDWDSTVMDVRVILRRALEQRSKSVILVHNHPSGNPRPGKADIQATARLREGLSAVDISLIDHIVVCDDRYYSFSEEKVFMDTDI